MSRFFDEEILSDDQIEESCQCNGGVSNQTRYNDYRNRMPFHYIEDGQPDGYYYWDFGATMNMEIELEDDIAFTDGSSNQYVPISDYFRDSLTKSLKFVLKDFRGNIINTQIVPASQLTLTPNSVKVTYKITEELSSIMVPNQYRLFIYIIDEVQNDPEEPSEIVFNKCLTDNGILIKVMG